MRSSTSAADPGASPLADRPVALPHWRGVALAMAGSIAFSGKAIIVKLAYRYGVDAVTLEDAKEAAKRLWGQGLTTVIVGRAPQAAARPTSPTPPAAN